MRVSAPALLWMTVLAVACGGQTATASGGAAEAPKCGDEPVRIVDYSPDVPDAAPGGGQIARTDVSDGYVFYLLNWHIPVGSLAKSDGALMRSPIRGGEHVRLAHVPGGGSGLAVAPSVVVFSQGDGDAGAIVSVPILGGETTILAPTSGLTHALVADDENVYFVDNEGTKSVPLVGGITRTLTTKTPFSITLAGGMLYLAETYGDKTLSSVPVGGGPVTVLATEPDGAFTPLACGPNLCWMSGRSSIASSSDFGGSSLKQVALSGGVPTILARGFSQSFELVFDGVSFFLNSGGSGSADLCRIPASGGELVLISGLSPVTSVSLDDTCLYWSSLDGIFSWALSAADTAPGLR